MRLQIIVGSTRPERVSNRLAKWAAKEAQKLEGIKTEILDLADYGLPFFDEPISPQYNPERKPNPAAQKWLDKLAQADAYMLITPEYNRSYPAVLKNALDYVDFQMAKKPVALLAHGSTGGAQAVAHLRGAIAGLQTFTIPKAVYFIGRAGELIDEAGNLDEKIKSQPYGPQTALEATLQDTKWYSDALSAARSNAQK